MLGDARAWRRPERWLAAILVAYISGFALFAPQVVLVFDEAHYVRAAWAFSRGAIAVEVREGLLGAVRREPPSTYPPGTSLLQAPLVRVLGFPGAPLASALCLCLTVLVLARWLVEQGRSPYFALLFLGYPPTLVLGRVGMSDLPSALVVALSLWLFFRSGPDAASGRPAAPRGALLAGLAAGASLLFRESNALVLAPFFVGAVLRREGRTLPLVAGGVLGLALRLLLARLLFGDAFYLREHGYGWSLAWALANLPLYLGALLVLAPLALFGLLAYRGPRRAEVLVAGLGTFAFYLAYGSSGDESGFFKRLILGPRYFVPLLPLLSVALAEALPRLWRERAGAGGTSGVQGGGRWGRLLAGERLGRLLEGERLGRWWAASVLVAALSVHPLLWARGRGQRELADALFGSTGPGGTIVLDELVLGKFLNEWESPRALARIDLMRPDELPRLLAREGVVWVALLARGESEFHRERAARFVRWSEEARRVCTLEVAHDAVHDGMRLQVFRVPRCG